jgi:protein-S-isoprenylcysteine O-methyltransferase Ste14
MEASMSTKQRAFVVVPLFIVALATVFGLVGYFLGNVLGIPTRFSIPILLRALGVVVLGLGFAMLVWISRYRKPADVVVSTYVTICKTIRRTPQEDKSARTEPLVLEGPQRHVRHPMYFAVVVLIFGWWLVLDYTFILFMTFFFFLWFNLVVIRFEERELRALYGQQYEAYAKAVPKFFPSPTRRWP